MTSLKQKVSLNPGESRVVQFSFTPQEAGVYQINVDGLVGNFNAIGVAKFYMPAKMDVVITDGTLLDIYWACEFSVVITNKGSTAGTHTISWRDNCGVISGSRQITLQPGENYTWKLSQWVNFRRLPGDYGVSEYIMYLESDWEKDNSSVGIAKA